MDVYQIASGLIKPTWITLLQWADILLVAYLIYRLLLLVRGTRAWRIFLGVALFIFLLVASKGAHLDTLHWMLDKAAILGPVALVILFLPELRQGLEGLGRVGERARLLVPSIGSFVDIDARTLGELVTAVAEMAADSMGALIVIERTAKLDDIASNGVPINARLTAPLLKTIFYEGGPLHDGAAIVRGDMIVAAACRLPLSESSRLAQNVHMRHRAAVGVSEALDCITIVVSEERGTISVAIDGNLRRLNSHIELRDLLLKELRGEERQTRSGSRRRAQKSRIRTPQIQSADASQVIAEPDEAEAAEVQS